MVFHVYNSSCSFNRTPPDVLCCGASNFCCERLWCMIVLFCQPRVGVTSCFVYKVMGLTFHDRINTQLIYKIEIAQVVARRITKPQKTFFLGSNLTGCSCLFIFFIYLFIFFWRGGGLILLFCSCLISFLFIFFIIILFFIPLTCIRYIYKNFCNNTSYCKFGNTLECER